MPSKGQMFPATPLLLLKIVLSDTKVSFTDAKGAVIKEIPIITRFPGTKNVLINGSTVQLDVNSVDKSE